MKVFFELGSWHVEFINDEEVTILSKFIFDNDYFVRKKFQKFSKYREHISKIPNRKLYADSVYHENLLFELSKNWDRYTRKGKLRKLDELVSNQKAVI